MQKYSIYAVEPSKLPEFNLKYCLNQTMSRKISCNRRRICNRLHERAKTNLIIFEKKVSSQNIKLLLQIINLGQNLIT